MITPSTTMAALMNQPVRTPIATALVQTATPDGAKAATQIMLNDIISYRISRTLELATDTCQLTFADDAAQRLSTNPNGALSPMFQPGPIDNKVLVYLGFQGPYTLGSTYYPYGSALQLRFTGFIQTDANSQQPLLNDKTLTIADLTTQFKFPINDTFPHPIYGNQTLSYFDPTYNLTNPSSDGVTWVCIGKQFSLSKDDKVYGTTHIDPAVYIDVTGGTSPQNTALSNTGWSVNSTTQVGTCANYSFDYKNGILTLTAAGANAAGGSGGVLPAGSVVSMAGNPTYMAPETMISIILTNFCGWSKAWVSLDATNILLPMFSPDGKTAWESLNMIAALTNPRFTPWVIWADENGYLRFFENRSDGPPVKTFFQGADIFTQDMEFTARQLRTVVRADAQVYTLNGDQAVTAIAYDVSNIQKYGQTEALQIAQDVTSNVRHLTQNDAAQSLQMLAASVLQQNSRPALTIHASINPNTSLQTGDKVAIKQDSFGMDREFLITGMQESGDGQSKAKHELDLTEYYDTINFSLGLPAAVSSSYPLGSTTSPPAQPIIGAVRIGTNPVYSFYNSDYAKNQNGDPILGTWDGTANLSTSPMHFDVFLNSAQATPATTSTPSQQWTFHNLPPGYGWAKTFIDNTEDDDSARRSWVYYGTVPGTPPAQGGTAGYTVYVGSDSVFYQFNHAAPITSADMITTNIWVPTGNTAFPGVGGTTGYPGVGSSVYLWQWWYLCQDSNLSPSFTQAKFYRPVMRLNPTTDGTATSVPSSNGLWVTQTWSNGPGPRFDVSGRTKYYGNVVIGCTDYTATPPGFVGANVMADGRNVGVAYGADAASNVSYTDYKKVNKGHFCIYAANNLGAKQFLRIPFYLTL